MPLGLLVILGVGLYLYVQQTRALAGAGPGLTDPNEIYKGWTLLTAWSQSMTGTAPAAMPASPADPAFTSLTESFQVWSNGKGYVFQPLHGTPGPLRTDGVLDAATLAVLDAHVQMTVPTGPQSFTTGGHYYLSFLRGTGGALSNLWSLTSEVDAPPPPTGLQGPAAWFVELTRPAGRSIAIGQWKGPQYGVDDRVIGFGSVKNVPTSAASWTEITSSVVAASRPLVMQSMQTKPTTSPPVAQPGCYRVSFDSLGTAQDSAAVAAAKMSADAGFELEAPSPSPASGGPWPADDVGSAMPSGTSGAGMPPPPPLPRVRMQWCVSRPASWPMPVGATNVRVWAQAATPDTVSYKGVTIALKDGGPSATPAARWIASAMAPRPGGAPLGPVPPAPLLVTGPTRADALRKAEAAIDPLELTGPQQP